MNHLQVNTHRDHPLVEEHYRLGQCLGVDSTLPGDNGTVVAPSDSYPAHPAEQSLLQAEQHQLNSSEFKNVEKGQPLFWVPKPLKEDGM